MHFAIVGRDSVSPNFSHQPHPPNYQHQPPIHIPFNRHSSTQLPTSNTGVFSDIAVASKVVLNEFPSSVAKILIVDLDVHQGNGNASIFKDDPRVFTASMHCAGNYFSPVEVSDSDLEVEIGAGDEDYLKLLDGWLPEIIEDSNPDLIFYQAGTL